MKSCCVTRYQLLAAWGALCSWEMQSNVVSASSFAPPTKNEVIAILERHVNVVYIRHAKPEDTEVTKISEASYPSLSLKLSLQTQIGMLHTANKNLQHT